MRLTVGVMGVADAVAGLVPLFDKPTGAVVLYDDDPVRLVDRLIAYYRTEHHKHPNCFCGPVAPAAGQAA